MKPIRPLAACTREKLMRNICTSIVTMSALVATGADSANAACSLLWGDYELLPDGTGSAELLWSCDQSMLAFQFDVTGLELIEMRDGLCGENGWQLYNGATTAIGFTLGQPPLPPTTDPVHFVTIDFFVTGDTLAFAEEVIFVAPPDLVIDVDWSDTIELNDCEADVYPKGSGDGAVGVDEILALLGDWSAVDSPYDINGDGVIGVDDLLSVLEAWGPCP